MDPDLPIKRENFDEDCDVTQVPSTKLNFYFKFPECQESDSLENDIKIEEEFISDSNSIQNDVILNSVGDKQIPIDYSPTLMSENTSSMIKNDVSDVNSFDNRFHENVITKDLSPNKSNHANSQSSKKAESSNTKEYDLTSENCATTYKKLTSYGKGRTFNEQTNKYSNVLTEKRKFDEFQELFSAKCSKSDASSSNGTVDEHKLSNNFSPKIIIQTKKVTKHDETSKVKEKGPVKVLSNQELINAKTNLFLSKRRFLCEICRLVVTDVYSIKNHIRSHTEFIKFRSKRYHITEEKALNDTYENHVSLSSIWPTNILAEFRCEIYQEKGKHTNEKETNKLSMNIERNPNKNCLNPIKAHCIQHYTKENKTSRCSVICEICKRNIKYAHNLKRHLSDKHSNFLQYRARKYQLTEMDALKDTYENHTSIYIPWPDGLLAEFSRKDIQENKQSSYKIQINTSKKKFSKDTESVSVIEHSEEFEQLRNIDLDEITNEHSIIGNTNLADKKNISKFDDRKKLTQPKNKSECYKIKKTLLNENYEKLVRRKDSQENKESSYKIEIDTSNTIFSKDAESASVIENSEEFEQLRNIDLDEITNEHLIIENKNLADKKIIGEVDDRKKLTQTKNKRECYKIRKTLLNKNYEKLVRSKSKLLEDFFCKEDNGKEIWFCITCHKLDPKVSKRSNKQQNWNCTGWHKSKLFLRLQDAMTKHLESKTHKKYKEKVIECQEVTTEELSMKTTQNLCITGQFFATHNLTQSFYPKQFELLHRVNENLGPSNKSKIHPLGNTHFSTLDLIEAQKACFLAVQEQMRDEDMKIFYPTGLLPRYTLLFEKATIKASQRIIIIMMKIDYKTGTSKEYLIDTSLIPPGNSKVLELVTKKTKELISTKRIAFLSCDKELVKSADKLELDLRMEKGDSYSDKIINLEDVRHNVDKILFPTLKEFPEHVKDEKWVVDTYIKAKEIIGFVITYPNFSKILREYSVVGAEKNVRYYPLQKKYNSLSLNFVLKNLKIMSKVLPEVLSANSLHDMLMKDLAFKILSQIQDQLFITRLFLLDKIFYLVLALQKTSQNLNIGPFEYISTKNNLIESLQDTKKYHEDEIRNIVECGTFEFKYMLRNKIKTNKVDLKEINLDDLPLKSTEFSQDDCCKLFTKWVDNLILRVDSYMPVPVCMRLAVNIFTFPDKKFSSGQFYEKLKDLRSFLLIVNTDFEECGENCKGITHCVCLSIQFNLFVEHILHRIKNCTDIQKTEYVDLYNFYLCELNFKVVKELGIRNVLRALEIFMLMKPSQFEIERVLSEMKKTACTTSGKVAKDDLLNINVFLRMNSSIEMIDAEWASSKYRDSNPK